MEKKEFNHYDRVLVRDCCDDKWRIGFYSHYEEGKMYPYVCLGNCYKYCIPYEGNEGLVDTTNVPGAEDTLNEKYIPKDGDFVTLPEWSSSESILIFKEVKDHRGIAYFAISDDVILFGENPFAYLSECYIPDLQPANEEKKQRLLSKLHDYGKDWDAEKKAIVDYVPDPGSKFMPKDGDFVYIETMGRKYIAIFRESTDTEMNFSQAFSEEDGLTELSVSCNIIFQLRPATEEEKQLLLDKIHEGGKDWDETNKKVVDLEWHPKDGEEFYYPCYVGNGNFEPTKRKWHDNFYNDFVEKHKFRTEEECKAKCEELNKAIENV